MGKYGAFKRNFDFSGLSPLEAQKMLGYVELMNQCMDRARIAANNAVSNYQNYYCRYEQKMEADLTLANYLLGHIDEAVAKGWINVLNALYPFSGSNHQELVENRFGHGLFRQVRGL